MSTALNCPKFLLARSLPLTHIAPRFNYLNKVPSNAAEAISVFLNLCDSIAKLKRRNKTAITLDSDLFVKTTNHSNAEQLDKYIRFWKIPKLRYCYRKSNVLESLKKKKKRRIKDKRNKIKYLSSNDGAISIILGAITTTLRFLVNR